MIRLFKKFCCYIRGYHKPISHPSDVDSHRCYYCSDCNEVWYAKTMAFGKNHKKEIISDFSLSKNNKLGNFPKNQKPKFNVTITTNNPTQYSSNMEEQVTQQPTVSYHQSELNWLMNKLWELGWEGFSEEEVQRAINIRDKNNLTTNL